MAGKQLKISVFMTATILLLSSSVTKATDRYWNVSSDNWSTAANWLPLPGTEPTSSDDAYIFNGGTANVTLQGEVCNYLHLGNFGMIEMTGGSFTASYSEYVGTGGTGTFNHSAGTNTVSEILFLGNDTDDNGTYNLSGTGLLNTSNEVIGDWGTGTFNHSAGINKVSGSYLVLGNNYGASGTYNLSSTGQLDTPNENIGSSGTGTFTQSGGTNTISNILNIGFLSGAKGTYNHSAGSNTVSNIVFLGFEMGSDGTYNLNGTGVLNTPHVEIGASGTGTFNHSGGTNTISDVLFLGTEMGGNGTYNLSDT
ncbi:MAG: hypothetical protein ABSE63_15045, partial [Thermoguttaceae bacterium]